MGGLPSWGRRKAGDIFSVVGKTDKWLVAATMTETRWRKWGGGEKKRAEIIFSQLWFLISPLSGHEFHPLFIGGGIWIFCL